MNLNSSFHMGEWLSCVLVIQVLTSLSDIVQYGCETLAELWASMTLTSRLLSCLTSLSLTDPPTVFCTLPQNFSIASIHSWKAFTWKIFPFLLRFNGKDIINVIQVLFKWQERSTRTAYELTSHLSSHSFLIIFNISSSKPNTSILTSRPRKSVFYLQIIVKLQS